MKSVNCKSNESFSTQKQDLIIGSWNIHGWLDATRNPNIDRVIQSLKVTPCDMVCIQETKHLARRQCDNYKKSPYSIAFKQELNYDHQSQANGEKRFYCFGNSFAKIKLK